MFLIRENMLLQTVNMFNMFCNLEGIVIMDAVTVAPIAVTPIAGDGGDTCVCNGACEYVCPVKPVKAVMVNGIV